MWHSAAYLSQTTGIEVYNFITVGGGRAREGVAAGKKLSRNDENFIFNK